MWEKARERAKRQIAKGEELHRQLGGNADLSTCKDAAHWLIEDGGAARQGDDPAFFLMHPWLAHLYPEAMRIERAAVRGWHEVEFRAIVAYLDTLGPSRAKDAARLRSHRIAAP